MKRSLQAATALLAVTAHPAILAAADTEHVVPLPELHQRAVDATRQRQQHLEEMDKFLSTEAVAESLRSAKVNPQQIRNAVALLSDAELARMAERAGRIRADFAAGALNNQELTYIVIALATAVLILVIVAA